MSLLKVLSIFFIKNRKDKSSAVIPPGSNPGKNFWIQDAGFSFLHLRWVQKWPCVDEKLTKVTVRRWKAWLLTMWSLPIKSLWARNDAIVANGHTNRGKTYVLIQATFIRINDYRFQKIFKFNRVIHKIIPSIYNRLIVKQNLYQPLKSIIGR